jgi:signal transduction histidine kinase
MGQQLVALKLGLDALKESASGDRRLAARLDRLLDLTRRLGRDMHRVAWELGTAAIEGDDLPRALASYAVDWSAQAGVPVHFHSSGRWEHRPPPQAESTVYRVVQEALTNVVKHAGAARVSLIVDRRADHLLAIVEDDGVGFDLEGAAAGDGRRPCLGLSGMRRRAEAVGGTVEVESAPRRGTTVFVRVPTGAAAGGGHE